MRLALTIADMGPGGAQRVAALLAGWWAGKGHEVSVVLLAPPGPGFFRLGPEVKTIGLAVLSESGNFFSALKANAHRLLTMRRALLELAPEAVVSFMDRTNVLTLLALLGMNIPVVISERNDPARQEIGKHWRWLRGAAYKRAAAAAVVSLEAAEFLRGVAPGVPARVVPNPAPQLSERKGGPPPWGRGPVVLAVGRLSSQKGLDVLLRAFAALADRRPEWRLALVGDGPEAPALRELAGQLGILERVSFTGNLGEPFAYADPAQCVYALPSRYEGFPNALLEAMCHGLPVIASDCSSAVAEMLADGRRGIMVPVEDQARLTQALDELMSDPAKRGALGQAAGEARQVYAMEKVAAQWDDLLTAVLEGRR
ncbi:hypothetical protein AAU61_00950 [Desulfocarbo indianensis]|nr:hypothetical protein AAU61_00950 [Desulfocarbo indianensis]